VARLIELNRPQFLECLKVRENRSTRRKVSSGLGETRGPATGEEGTEKEHRSAELPYQNRIRPIRRDLLTSDPKRRGPHTFYGRAQACHQLHQDVDVADARHVRQHTFLIRQQARGKKRQR
jgi:hypothetical protein